MGEGYAANIHLFPEYQTRRKANYRHLIGFVPIVGLKFSKYLRRNGALKVKLLNKVGRFIEQKSPKAGANCLGSKRKRILYPIGSWRLGFQPSRTLSGVNNFAYTLVMPHFVQQTIPTVCK